MDILFLYEVIMFKKAYLLKYNENDRLITFIFMLHLTELIWTLDLSLLDIVYISHNENSTSSSSYKTIWYFIRLTIIH